MKKQNPAAPNFLDENDDRFAGLLGNYAKMELEHQLDIQLLFLVYIYVCNKSIKNSFFNNKF